VIGNNGGAGVDEDALAEHKGAILAGAHLDWDRLAAAHWWRNSLTWISARTGQPADAHAAAGPQLLVALLVGAVLWPFGRHQAVT
jgi:hypothetical protein